MKGEHTLRSLRWIVSDKRTVSILLTLAALLFQSCEVPLIYLQMAGDSQKDVSDNFNRGHVVGKEYELLRDVYLTQSRDSERLYLSCSLYRTWICERGKSIEVNPYLICEKIPAGSKFRVCLVLVKTNYGNEVWRQDIFAKFIDDQANIIEKTNVQGSVQPVNVNQMFANTSQMPNIDWTFLPRQEWIREIK